MLAAARAGAGDSATGGDARLEADDNVADWIQTAHPEGRGRSNGAAAAGVTTMIAGSEAAGLATLVSKAGLRRGQRSSPRLASERVVSETVMARAIVRTPRRKAATGRTPLAQLPLNAACPHTGLRLHTL